LATYQSPGLNNDIRFAFIRAGFLELNNVELPEEAIISNYMIYPTSGSFLYITDRYCHGNEGGLPRIPNPLYPPSETTSQGTFIYSEGLLRRQNDTVTVGVSDTYGAKTYFDVYLAKHTKIQITTANVSGEIVTVELVYTYMDGTTKTLEKEFDVNTSYLLDIDDFITLNYSCYKKLLSVRAKTDQGSTSATVTIDVVTE